MATSHSKTKIKKVEGISRSITVKKDLIYIRFIVRIVTS